MKKYVYLFLGTLVMIGVIVMSGYMVNGSTAETEIFTLKPQEMSNTVTASGKLQYQSGKSVQAEEWGIIKEIKVKSGDKVKKGDVLFSYYQAEMASQYADMQNVEALLGNSSLKEQILEEVKKYCTVREICAEMEGKVSGVPYQADDIVSKGADVIKLSNTGVLEIPVNVNENYIDRVAVGQKAEIAFRAVPDKEYTGKVTKISDEAVQTTGLSGKETTVSVTVTLEGEKDDKLRIGYSADCTIVTSTDKNVLVLPYEYIHSDDEGDYVLTAVKGRAKKVYFTAGKEYKDGTEIVSGLDQEDKIIKNTEINDGQGIIIKE